MAGKSIAVLGLGFVGLTTGLGFAEKGQRVIGFDVAQSRLAGLRAGRLDFHEPHLPEMLGKHLGGSFTLADSLAAAVAEAGVVFLCVGTPTGDDGAVDTGYLEAAVQQTVAAAAGRELVIVIKSTVPPGTTRRALLPLVAGSRVTLATNPEFLREGFAWDDFTGPDRIVIGATDPATAETVAALYANFSAEILRVSLTTAEFIKSTSNAFLATLISFANECAHTARTLGDIDIRAAFSALHADRRWTGAPAKMNTYFFPGCGYGGYCLPKDTVAFAHASETAGAPMPILRSVVAGNSATRAQFVERLARAARPGEPVGVLGLAFKPGSDDVRDTPALHIVRGLLERGLEVVAYDPMACEPFDRAYQLPITYAEEMAGVVEKCSVIAVLTAWPEFKAQQHLLKGKDVLDGRYFLELEK